MQQGGGEEPQWPIEKVEYTHAKKDYMLEQTGEQCLKQVGQLVESLQPQEDAKI